MKQKWKNRIVWFYRSWIFSILITVLIATSFKSAVADWNVVPTGSMKPTIVEGDRIFINKLAYDLKLPYTTLRLAAWDDPERGDIVVFYSPLDGTRLVKRVAGVPGDAVRMVNNRLYINGRPAAYEALSDAAGRTGSGSGTPQRLYLENLAGRKHPIMTLPGRLSPRSFGPVTVPDGQYFMLGDNRDNSADSRYFGFVPRSAILGRASAVVASLDAKRRYKPRWDRFFTKLP